LRKNPKNRPLRLKREDYTQHPPTVKLYNLFTQHHRYVIADQMFNPYIHLLTFHILSGGIMNRQSTIITAFMLAFIFTAGAYADYDSSAVKAIMKNNVGALNMLKKAVNESDFKSAGKAFETFANNMKPLLQMTPPHGSKADWDASINEFIATAQTGAKVSGESDIEKVKKALNDLQTIMKKGHGEFK
jgi:hypothetical protein